jgi:hypothetical protein
MAVLFSASIVLAAQPASPGSKGLDKAAQHAGQGVGAGDEQSGEPDESAEPSESAEPTDSAEPGDSPDANQCNIDLTDPAAVAAAPNHGAVVCSAANMPTPSGYANHGAWVSHWARMNHGSDASANGQSHKPSTIPPTH